MKVAYIGILLALASSFMYLISVLDMGNEHRHFYGEHTDHLTLTTVTPELQEIPEQFVNHKVGESFSFAPIISNKDKLNGLVHWVKTYGPDGVQINPKTGRISWDINIDMPSESFHIGLKASSRTTDSHISLIIHAGVDHVLHVGPNTQYSTIKQGLKALRSGGTLVLLDGTYEGEENHIGLTEAGEIQHPTSGDNYKFTTIMAKHPSKAILKNGAYVRLHGNWPVSFVAIKGLYVIDGQIAVFGNGRNRAESELRHHHIKFIRNGVQGGDTQSPFNAFRSDNILYENNYAFGGGRYKFTSYQAENIVWRRNVARYDRGPVFDEPKGTYSVYSTMDGFLSNNLAVDSDRPDFVVQGELSGEFTTPTTSGDTRARFHRNIQLNSAFLFGNMDEQQSNGEGGDSDVIHSDVISWDIKPESRYVMSWGSAWFDHLTMGKVTPRYFANYFFNGYHNNSRGITNSILHDFNNGDMFYSLEKKQQHITVGREVEKYGVDSVNISNFSGILNISNSNINNMFELNPIHNSSNPKGSLRYLLRSEPNTNMSGKGLDGEDLGATVMTFLGKSGTFHGDEGFDQETGIAMWPFPMEHIIKQKFSEYEYKGPTYTGRYSKRVESGEGILIGARGFAVEGQTLTNYIWGYLGSIVPPFNVTSILEGDRVVLQWAGPITDSEQYNVYSMKGNEKKLIAKIENGNRVKEFIGMDEGTYCFAVTSLVKEEESSFSYPSCIQYIE